ncbi:tetratricopeptide repeat protein [Pleurocapsa sp. PCC 7319]|uniref:tetratricopeptide repeat protein n=1 Tax=Pleurocapsa sp. PCC 7319 TaxID=118161 RepID=UPI000345AB85|nr:tetratricopeptide repeat protein [Pleurocapsa sp. PCC 7319]
MIRGESSIKNIKSLFAQGEWEQVINICQNAIANDPNAIDFYLYLAKTYTQQEEFAAAISTYQKLLGTSVNQAEIYAELGLLHSRQKKLERAVWHYEQALALKPDWAELRYNLAVVLHQLGNWQGAIAAYNKAAEIKPDYAAVYFNLGVIYDQKGELEAAIASYEKVIAIQPDFIRAYSNWGSTLARQQEYDLAIATFKQGLNLDPTWATLHNNLGQVYWFSDQPGLAIDSFETAITLDPKMALAHHNLGRLWQQQGNSPQAIRCFRKVIELEPNNVLAYSYCSDVLQKIGNLEVAFDYWRQIIELQPEFVNAYCQRILTLEAEDLLEIAKVACACFLQALKQNNYAEAYHHLWRTYYLMGDVLFEYGGIEQAAIYYQQALQIKPQEVETYLKLGNCLAKQKRLDAAIAIYQIGLNLEPEHPQICFQLGKVLERTKDAEQAIDYYEAVLNQQLDQIDHWDNLPSLFPSEANLALLPQQIYHYTQDWIRDCQLEDFNYVQVLWEDNNSNSGFLQITGTRQPTNINTNILDQNLRPDCGGVNCNTCMSKLVKYFQPLQIGKNVYQCSFQEVPPVKTPRPFVVTIPQGRTWIAPQKNSWIICNAIAVITPDNYLLGDLSRDYPWFLPECPYQERTDHTVFSLEKISSVEKITGKVALLSSLAGHVYYHWMFDILPRIELIKRSGINPSEIDWFVINSLSKPYQQETLKLLGIPAIKIIESDRHNHIQATELIVPSFPGYLDWVPEGTIRFLRQTFLPHINLTQKNAGKKIYVSRARSKNRHLVNELEVSNLLHSQGFQTVFLEEMSVLEQVATFANAEIIVAPHGSGLTNLVFCSPDAKVIELFSPNYVRTDYWMISQKLQLLHYYVIGQSFDCSPLRSLMYQNALTEDILVNINSLRLILEYIQ